MSFRMPSADPGILSLGQKPQKATNEGLDQVLSWHDITRAVPKRTTPVAPVREVHTWSPWAKHLNAGLL